MTLYYTLPVIDVTLGEKQMHLVPQGIYLQVQQARETLPKDQEIILTKVNDEIILNTMPKETITKKQSHE